MLKVLCSGPNQLREGSIAHMLHTIKIDVAQRRTGMYHTKDTLSRSGGQFISMSFSFMKKKKEGKEEKSMEDRGGGEC